MENNFKFEPTLFSCIIGDVSGSRFEFNPIKNKDFELLIKNEVDHYARPDFDKRDKDCRYTDDTVMTIAVAHALLEANDGYENLGKQAVKYMKYYGNKYQRAGYGGLFRQWLKQDDSEPYNSFGNGSAMRISPVAYFAKSLEEVKTLSKIVTEVTHNHPDGIKGAEAVAVCIYLATKGKSKEEIKEYVEANYYDLNFDYEELKQTYKFYSTCKDSIPQSIYCFLISNDYEDAIKNAISLGGDADTMGAITGSIAGAYYGVSSELIEKCKTFLPEEFIEIIEKFNQKVKK